jgi:hypothetical protein
VHANFDLSLCGVFVMARAIAMGYLQREPGFNMKHIWSASIYYIICMCSKQIFNILDCVHNITTLLIAFLHGYRLV